MSKASGFVVLLTGAGLAVCAAGHGTDTGEATPDSSAMVSAGNVEAAAARSGEIAEEHGSPGAASATLILPQVPAEPAPRLPILEPEPSTARTQSREALTRALQRELRRLGCYTGSINSTWSLTTRAAAKAFMERVNARLPTNQPDHVLLALARAHQDKTCVQRCPEASDPTQRGRCLSIAVMARGPISSGSSTLVPPAAAHAVATSPGPASMSPPTPSLKRAASISRHASAARHRQSIQRAESDRVRRQHSDFASTLFARLDANLP